MAKESGCMQLIDGEGKFNVTGFKNFEKEVEMDEWGPSYAVVSIMGQQSGGKSTLLNHLFDTNFRVMDVTKKRGKTTNGIWVARYAGVEPRPLLVMDLEGTDGSERGEDDTKFEKWSALFALAISDIVLINMWCHDLGLENAANKPLLRTVFQVMLRICSPPRKVTLMFVLRDQIDQTEAALKLLREQVLEDMEKIWNDSIGSGKRLEEFFDVKVEALCHYVLQRDQFKKEVAGLRPKIFHSIISGGVDSGRGPASSFSLKAQRIWENIKVNKDLDIPAVKVLVATYHCDKIAKEKLERFTRDYNEAKKGSGKSFSSLLKKYLSEYDEETLYYDKVTRSEKRKKLEAEMRQLQVETDFDWKRGETATVAVSVVTGLSAAGIAAAALAIPGMQLVAVAMIPLIVSAVGNIAATKLKTKEKLAVAASVATVGIAAGLAIPGRRSPSSFAGHDPSVYCRVPRCYGGERVTC